MLLQSNQQSLNNNTNLENGKITIKLPYNYYFPFYTI